MVLYWEYLFLDFDASDVKLDPEKVAVSKPDKPEGSGEVSHYTFIVLDDLQCSQIHMVPP